MLLPILEVCYLQHMNIKADGMESRVFCDALAVWLFIPYHYNFFHLRTTQTFPLTGHKFALATCTPKNINKMELEEELIFTGMKTVLFIVEGAVFKTILCPAEFKMATRADYIV